MEVQGDKPSKTALCGLHICCTDQEQLIEMLELGIKSNLSQSEHKNSLFVAIRTRETNCQHPVCKQTLQDNRQEKPNLEPSSSISSGEAEDPLKMFVFPLTAEQLRVTCITGHSFERWYFWIFRTIPAKKIQLRFRIHFSKHLKAKCSHRILETFGLPKSIVMLLNNLLEPFS